VGQVGEMTQTMYAHVNKLTIKKISSFEKKKKLLL
jgi:hypothetical protein